MAAAYDDLFVLLPQKSIQAYHILATHDYVVGLPRQNILERSHIAEAVLLQTGRPKSVNTVVAFGIDNYVDGNSLNQPCTAFLSLLRWLCWGALFLELQDHLLLWRFGREFLFYLCLLVNRSDFDLAFVQAQKQLSLLHPVVAQQGEIVLPSQDITEVFSMDERHNSGWVGEKQGWDCILDGLYC